MRIECSKIKWDSIYTKESHPSKPLHRHIGEVREYYDMLRGIFRIDRGEDDIDILIDLVVKYHDMGKLHPNWRIGLKGGRHSEYSILWLLCHRDELDNYLDKHGLNKDGFIKTLYMLILKHHSLMDITPPSIRDKLLKRVFRRDIDWLPVDVFIEGLDLEGRIKLADLYGLFKIADIISASVRCRYEVSRLIQAPKPINVNDVKSIISGEGFDENRWVEQKALMTLGGLAMLRAYTGWGKTTVSLLYTIGKNPVKIFYLLPTITSINKFYMGLRDVIGGDRVGRFFYLYDAYLAIKGTAELGEELERLHNLFYARHFLDKYINITTVDQLILSFLFIGRYYMKRFVFRGSTIILDELHLLNPVMMDVIIEAIRVFQKIYKFNILMMSASLPDNLKKYLEDRLGKNIEFLDYIEGYKTLRRIMYNIIDDDISAPKSIETILNDYEANRRNILVIVNTVDKAIRIAKVLREELGGDKVILLHSRMMYRDRVSREELIDSYLRNNVPHILVSTQVAEVSLDISYDTLYTELAPIGNIIQRFGRVNRYGKWINNINSYIYTPAELDREPRYYPYSRDELYISLGILKELEGDRLKSEYDLIHSYNESESYDEFRSRMAGESERIKISLYNEKSKYFYSLDLDEESVKELLEYRGLFTVLTLPDPEMVTDARLRNELNELINVDYTSLPDDMRDKLFSRVKSYLIPIPIYIIRQSIPYDKGFPIISIKGYLYDTFLGLYKLDGGEIIG